MRFVSTRGQSPATGIADALQAGLAPDGGLYVPEHIPQVSLQFAPDQSLADTACHVLRPYVANSALAGRLAGLCAQAFSFPAPLRALSSPADHLLELFHGPTAAFKDYAARFLAGALEALRPPGTPEDTVLVATSGDTGAAVAAAFDGRPGFRVVIVYPDGRVSPRQAHGLECWGDNVEALRVDGTFDDCQRMVKHVLADAELRRRCRLTSANSISLGRLLPQIAYHAHAALAFTHAHATPLNLIVPTGNLGNACAAWLARAMGAPLGEIVLATNANPMLSRFFAGEPPRPQATIATLANAMDVGVPSNFERLRHWHGDDTSLRQAMRAIAATDADIRAVIAAAPERHGITPCPHTACGLHALHRLREDGDHRPWAVAATAHPAKFDSIVTPLVGRDVPLPPALADCLARPRRYAQLAADDSALRTLLLDTAILPGR